MAERAEGEPEACFHSVTDWNCNSCLRGYIARQDAHINRLREMLKGLGGEAPLEMHDRFWFGGNADFTVNERPPATRPWESP